MRPAAYLDAWQGLGDTIYLRPSIRALAKRHELYIATPWPELLEDLDVRFVRPVNQYRCQTENAADQDDGRWEEIPAGAIRLEPRVQWRSSMSVPAGIADSLGLDVETLTYDLPPFTVPSHAAIGAYAVVRPAVVRKEWENPARNPDPRYVAATAAELQERGLKVVSVAHLKAGEEWALDPLPPADVVLHAGELNVGALMGLVRGASVVVGGPGWIVPACVAYGTRCLMIGGGQGHYNRPQKLVPAWKQHRMGWILPDDYCRDCHDPDHDCPKEITRFEEKLEAALQELGL